MTEVDKRTNEHDLETPDSIQVRFGEFAAVVHDR
jgi:hypothetical protein